MFFKTPLVLKESGEIMQGFRRTGTPGLELQVTPLNGAEKVDRSTFHEVGNL
jgi:hypothetical protein